MGFYRQPNSWLCGPYALKHALLLVGVRADERAIAQLAGTDPSGTDEAELARAARHFDCDLQSVRRRDAEAARHDLATHLERGMPVLLCIEQWDHWVVAAHEHDGSFVIVDSRAPAIFRILPWEYLRDLLAYREGQSSSEIYDLHPLVPLRDAGRRPVLTLDRARFLQEWENQVVARDWHRFLADAQEVVGSENDAEGPAMTPGLFLGRHELAVLDGIAPDNESGRRTEARRVLRGLRFLADTYGFRVAAVDESNALQRLDAVLRRRLGAPDSVN
jgi:hypothetical protein